MSISIDVTNLFLESERLLLRPWKLSDLDDFYEYASVPGVGEMAGWPHHTDIKISEQILKNFMDEKNVLALVLKENNKVIGSFGFHHSWAEKDPRFEHLKSVEIGYVLSRDYWGKGLMPEAIQRVIPYLFEDIKLDAITVGHFTHNNQSRRVIEKCGFQFMQTDIYKAKLLGKEFEEKQYILLSKEAKTIEK